jgi:hypothetical protein
MDPSGPEPFLPFSHAHAKMAEKEALQETWAVFWIASREYRQTKLFFPKPDTKMSKDLIQLTMLELGLLIRHLTGHSFLSYHQSKVHPGTYSPKCRLCEYIKEESAHIIKKCPALATLCLQNLWQAEVDDLWFIPALLNLLLSKQVIKLEKWDDPELPPAPNALNVED